jgi:hypothetical protein
LEIICRAHTYLDHLISGQDRIIYHATACIDQRRNESGVEMKLTRGHIINGKNLYLNTPLSVTITAQDTPRSNDTVRILPFTAPY